MTRYEAFGTDSIVENGMSHVIVARIRGPVDVEIGVFLVDAWCLGIKDAFLVEDATEDELRVAERMPDSGQPLRPACAEKID